MSKINLTILFFLLLIELNCSYLNPSSSNQNFNSIQPSLKISQNLDVDEIDSAIAIVEGDGIDGSDVFPLILNKAEMKLVGIIRIPKNGSEWTVTIQIFDTLSRKIGQGSQMLSSAEVNLGVFIMDPIGIESAKPKILSFGGIDSIVSIYDTITFNATAKDSFGGSVDKWEWDFGNTGNFIETSDGDTIITAPSIPQPFICVLKVRDNDSNFTLDSILVDVILDPPQPNIVEDSAYVDITDTFTVTFNGTDAFGEIKMFRFDITGDGVFDDSANAAGSKTFTAPLQPGEYAFILQAQDDDGVTANDTMYLDAVYFPPMAKAGEDTSIAKNDTLLLIGSGSIAGTGQIVKYEWDIRNTGTFKSCSTGDTSIITPDSLNLNGWECVLKVTDEFDGISIDTVMVYITIAPYLATQNAPFLARSNHTSVVFDNKIWVIGGITGSENKNDVWSSTNGIDWIEVTSNANFSPRYSHASVVYNNKIWVIGGGIEGDQIKDVWNSTDGVNWTLVTDTANFSKRREHSVTVFKDTLWLIGGWRSDPNTTLSDIWKSGDGINWTLVADPAVFGERSEHKTCVFDNKFWVILGINATDVWNSIDGINWIEITSSAGLPHILGHTSTVFESRMWIIGGADDFEERNIWFSSNGIDWIHSISSPKSLPNFINRLSHSTVVFNNRIWLIGGWSSQYQMHYNDVWYFE